MLYFPYHFGGEKGKKYNVVNTVGNSHLAFVFIYLRLRVT